MSKLESKLELPNITLIALTNRDFKGHKRAIDKSCENIDFGAVKIIWDEKIQDINDWNYKIIYELHNYIDTEFAMLIHADGYIIHPEAWQDAFLDYDYIGAPWPLPQDDYSYRTPDGTLVRVGNSVSIRSKRIMALPTILGLEWKSYYGNTNEDGKLCVEWKEILEKEGIKYAPLEIAKYFSKEHETEENKDITPFAFHSL